MTRAREALFASPAFLNGGEVHAKNDTEMDFGHISGTLGKRRGVGHDPRLADIDGLGG